VAEIADIEPLAGGVDFDEGADWIRELIGDRFDTETGQAEVERGLVGLR
jgi:hypothetical protein